MHYKLNCPSRTGVCPPRPRDVVLVPERATGSEWFRPSVPHCLLASEQGHFGSSTAFPFNLLRISNNYGASPVTLTSPVKHAGGPPAAGSSRRRTRRIGNLRVYYDVEHEPEAAVYVRAVGVKERNRVRIGKEVIQL